MTLCLFLGGPADGKWLNVPANCTAWRVGHEPDILLSPGKIAPVNMSGYIHTYYATFFEDGERTRHRLFVAESACHPSDASAWALRRLMDGYRPHPKKGRVRG